MNKTFKIQISFSLILAIPIFFAYGPQSMMAFLFGSLAMLMNAAALAIVLNRVLHKNSVAPTLLLVVTKYAFLGLFVYFIVKTESLPLLWIVAGFCTLIPAALLGTIIKRRTQL